MSSRENIVNGHDSGGIQGSGSSEPSTSTRTTRTQGSSKRARVSSSSATVTERAIQSKPLLRNLAKHPSTQARRGKSIPTNNLNFRGAWPTAVELYKKAHQQYKDLFDASGFKHFLSIKPVHIPQAYAIALRERWISETNTVHLPNFEIGPTPLDWTMITGLYFRGQIISVNPKYSQHRALELLGAGRLDSGKIRLSSIMPTEEEVQADPENDETKERIFRRLFLFVVGSCFFTNNRSVIHHGLVEFLERIDQVGRYDWGAVTYATFLYEMRRQVTGKSGSFTGFWPFLVFWAYEYINISRPGLGNDDFPRARRWTCPQSESGPLHLEDVISFRCQLNYVKEDQMKWQPYLDSAKFRSHAMDAAIELSKKRVPFESLYTWEYYLGERCRRQLGLLCRVPHPPPKNMYGTAEVRPEDPISIGRSAERLVMDERVTYRQWFTEKSIGNIVEVNQLLGGPNTAGEVFEDWLKKHRPDMQLILKSEYEQVISARNTAVAAHNAAVAARDAAVADRDAAIAELSKYRKDHRATTESSLNERRDGD